MKKKSKSAAQASKNLMEIDALPSIRFLIEGLGKALAEDLEILKKVCDGSAPPERFDDAVEEHIMEAIRHFRGLRPDVDYQIDLWRKQSLTLEQLQDLAGLMAAMVRFDELQLTAMKISDDFLADGPCVIDDDGMLRVRGDGCMYSVPPDILEKVGVDKGTARWMGRVDAGDGRSLPLLFIRLTDEASAHFKKRGHPLDRIEIESRSAVATVGDVGLAVLLYRFQGRHEIYRAFVNYHAPHNPLTHLCTGSGWYVATMAGDEVPDVIRYVDGVGAVAELLHQVKAMPPWTSGDFEAACRIAMEQFSAQQMWDAG